MYTLHILCPLPLFIPLTFFVFLLLPGLFPSTDLIPLSVSRPLRLGPTRCLSRPFTCLALSRKRLDLHLFAISLSFTDLDLVHKATHKLIVSDYVFSRFSVRLSVTSWTLTPYLSPTCVCVWSLLVVLLFCVLLSLSLSPIVMFPWTSFSSPAH